MSISSINPVAIAAPLSGLHRAASAPRGSERFHADSDAGKRTSGDGRSPRVAAIGKAAPTGSEQRRQYAGSTESSVFFAGRAASLNNDTPAAQLLGELINRMGGAGVYSGPGQLINIAL